MAEKYWAAQLAAGHHSAVARESYWSKIEEAGGPVPVSSTNVALFADGSGVSWGWGNDDDGPHFTGPAA